MNQSLFYAMQFLGAAGYTAITVGSTPAVIKSGTELQLACVVDVTFYSSCYGKFSSNGTLTRDLYKDADFSSYIDVSISNGNLIISKVSASVSTIKVYYKITKLS